MYETPDTPSSTVTKKYEDDSQSDSVSKLECGVGKSYDTFKGKSVDSQNTGISVLIYVVYVIACIYRLF